MSARHSRSAQRLPQTKRGPSTRAGFTLLETMVALALCGLIIAAVGTATHLYWKYRSLTKGQIHTAHLVRGLTEDVSEALRSVTPLWVPEPGDDSEILVTRQQNDSVNDFSTDLTQANSQLLAVPEPVPFVGTSQLFAVLTEHPSSRFEPSDELSNFSGPKHVVWWIHTTHPAGVQREFQGVHRTPRSRRFERARQISDFC
jgi:prepilin-type N-terminal cleavage/methylation domain-containing protein